MMNPDDIKIRDIKPLLEIPDQSIYLFMALAAVTVVIVFSVLYLIIKWVKNKNRITVRKATYEKLLHASLLEPKKAAYEITKYGYLFKDDAPRNAEMYKNLVERLDRYKYKKEVEPIDEETKSYFELYKGMIDV